MEEVKDRLQQARKMEAIGTLATGIARDFNNILSVIAGYTELFGEDLPEGSTTRENLSMVLNATHRAKELVKQILVFSRQREHEKRPFRVDLLVEEALRTVCSSLPPSIEMVQDIGTALSPVMGDPTQVYQVVLNLCNNASQAIGDRLGTIEASLREVRLKAGGATRLEGLLPGTYPYNAI